MKVTAEELKIIENLLKEHKAENGVVVIPKINITNCYPTNCHGGCKDGGFYQARF